jgi:hypothetical protein
MVQAFFIQGFPSPFKAIQGYPNLFKGFWKKDYLFFMGRFRSWLAETLAPPFQMAAQQHGPAIPFKAF